MAYVVVGASAAGINAAKTLREINKDIEIILVSKDEYVYSRCILHHFLDGRRDIEDLDFSPGEFFKKYDIKWMKGVEVTDPGQPGSQTGQEQEHPAPGGDVTDACMLSGGKDDTPSHNQYHYGTKGCGQIGIDSLHPQLGQNSGQGGKQC